MALQALFRSGELVAPRLDLHTLVVFLAMPAAAAAAVAVLAVRHGRGPALVAAATAVLVSGGLDVAATTGLVALAAGELWRAPISAETPSAADKRHHRLLAILAVAALAVPFAWQLTIPALAAGAALLLSGRLRPAVPIVVGVTALAAAVVVPGQPATATLGGLGVALLLLPLLPWSLGDVAVGRPRRALPIIAGVLLAVAAAGCAPQEGMAAPLGFLALTLAGARRAWVRGDGVSGDAPPPLPAGRRNVLILQGLWSGGLLLAAAVLAAYPWLRPRPLDAALAAAGLDPFGWHPVWVAAVAFLLAALPSPARLARRGGRAPDALAGPREYAGTAVFVAFVLAAPPFPTSLGRTPVGSPGVLLTAAAPRVVVALDGRRHEPHGVAAPARQTPTATAAATAPTAASAAASAPAEPRTAAVEELVLDGNLVHAAGLADGTPVATVTLLAHGAPVATWQVAAGDDLAEWAARRSDVAPLVAHRAPPPWVSWVAPGGGYFGQTYRARHRLGAAVEADQLVVERDRALAPDVAIHVQRLETWP